MQHFKSLGVFKSLGFCCSMITVLREWYLTKTSIYSRLQSDLNVYCDTVFSYLAQFNLGFCPLLSNKIKPIDLDPQNSSISAHGDMNLLAAVFSLAAELRQGFQKVVDENWVLVEERFSTQGAP